MRIDPGDVATRLTLTGADVAAGALATCGTAGAAGAGPLVAALSALGGIAGNIFAGDLH